nr:MAG TPA_asm: hypothetical protein [Caudoviricetes sp.]
MGSSTLAGPPHPAPFHRIVACQWMKGACHG